MSSVQVDNRAGVSTTTGTGDYVISGSLSTHKAMVGGLTDGSQYSYYAKYSDSAIAGFETGQGNWNAGSNTLVRTTIKTSSNGDAKVDWAAGEKTIFIVTDTESATDMSRMVESSTAKVMTGTERTKLSNITITQPVNLDQLESDVADLADPFFPEKPAGEPVVLVATGQSNMTGAYTATGLVQNANVYDWEDTAANANPVGPFLWRVADPSRVSGWTLGVSTVFVGMRGSNYGNIAWSAADLIQRTTGRDVYIITVHYSGSPIVNWLNGGSVETELATQVPAAMAAIPNAPSTPDFIIWMQGESDRSRPGEDYAADLLSVKSTFESKWATVDRTRWLVCGHSDLYQSVQGYWSGLDLFLQDTNQNVQFVSAIGASDTTDFAIHYDGPGLKEMGRRTGVIAFSGFAPKQRQVRSSKNIVWAEGTEDTAYFGDGHASLEATATDLKLEPSGTVDTQTIALFGEKRPTDALAPQGVAYKAPSAHDDATSGNRDGGVATLQGGDGALNQNGNGGNAVLQPGAGNGTGIDGFGLVNGAVYGQLAAFGNSTAEPVVNDSTGAFLRITAFNFGSGVLPSNGMTASTSTDTLDIEVDGLYYVHVDLTLEAPSGGEGKTAQIGIYKVGSALTGTMAEAQFSATANDPVPISLTALVQATAGEQIDVRQRVIQAGGTMLITNGQVTAMRLSN